MIPEISKKIIGSRKVLQENENKRKAFIEKLKQKHNKEKEEEGEQPND